MNKLLRAPLCSLWFITMALALSLHAQEWRKIPIPQLPPFHPHEPKRVELPNGMVVFLQEDHELPLIDAIARIRGGSRAEPAGKTGLVSLYGDVWRTGGTRTQTGDQLDDYLEIRAAKVETGGNADSTTISLSCLKEDFDDVFQVFNELLRQPEFRADKLDLAKNVMFDAISRRNDEPSEIAYRESAKLAYGDQNPYVRVPEYATVAAVSRQDLIDWHHTYVHPNNIILGIVGDFDSAQMESKLRNAFGNWPKGPSPKPPDIKFTPAPPGYYLVKKEDVNQSNIQMVGLGTTRDNPDYFAIEVLNEALGGGFSARLIQSIRTAQGLAYAVGGGVGTRFDHPGILRFVVGTKSGSTVEAIQALYREIDKLKTDPITGAEIARAKDTILNAFVFNFDTPQKVLRERMAYEFYGYPADFLERYRAGIEKATAADVNRVAAKYLHKDQLAVLVVGNAAEFDKPLSSLGVVKDVDITIPPPPGGKTAQDETAALSEKKPSNPEGKALAAKVAKALGGEDKLKAVKALKSDYTLTQLGGPAASSIQAQSTIVFPDRLKVDLQTPRGNFSMVVTPAAGFMAAEGMGSQDIPASRKNEMVEQIHRDLIYVAQHVSDPAFSFTALGTEKSGNLDTAAVDVSGPGVSLRWFVDPQTGKIIRETYKAMGQSGPVDTETVFSDWKNVEGLNLPFHRDNRQEGKDSSSVQFSSIQINPAVDPKIFEKPAAPAQ
ncbi:MAG TPA: pitrilysin family protein [Terriglobales bacterium]|nr:pitrilysin family protein [Terriglobales bacterium]